MVNEGGWLTRERLVNEGEVGSRGGGWLTRERLVNEGEGG